MFPRFTRLPAGPRPPCAPQLRDGRVCTGPRGTPGPCTFRPLRPPHSVPWPPHPPAEEGFTFGSRRSLGFAGSSPRVSAHRRRSVNVFGAEQTSGGGRSARIRLLPRGPSRAASPPPSGFDVIAPLRPPPSPGKRRSRSSSGTAEVVRVVLGAGEPSGGAPAALPSAPLRKNPWDICFVCGSRGPLQSCGIRTPRLGLDTVESTGTAKCCIKAENPGATQFLRVSGCD